VQITDISQFGTPQQVASLVLPRDVRLLGTAITKTPLPPKDTGTVLGVVERDPITTYRCLPCFAVIRQLQMQHDFATFENDFDCSRRTNAIHLSAFQRPKPCLRLLRQPLGKEHLLLGSNCTHAAFASAGFLASRHPFCIFAPQKCGAACAHVWLCVRRLHTGMSSSPGTSTS
jgi:hypothetical protein